MKTLSEAPSVDLFSAEFQANPSAVLTPLRETTWIVQTIFGGMVISRHHVQALLADTRLRSSVADFIRMQGITDGDLHDRMSASILATDGEDHLRIRRLASRAFTPRSVERHRDDMRRTLQALLDPIAAAGRCDFMAAISEHYPIQVMCHMLGVPDEDHGDFAKWNRSITWALSFNLADHREEIEWGFNNLDAYVTELVAERRRQPRDDLVTAIAQATEADDRLTDEEIRGMIAALLFAGYDTTRNQLGIAMWLFAENPDQWRLLRDEPELAAQAVEEVLRHRGAVGAVPRVTVADIELDGWRIPAGTMVSLATSAANHDPAAFERPDVFDISIAREPQFTFGGGPHYCLGASLARAEMQVALPMLAQTMPGLALDGEPVWRPPFGITGPDVLPIRWLTPGEQALPPGPPPAGSSRSDERSTDQAGSAARSEGP